MKVGRQVVAVVAVVVCGGCNGGSGGAGLAVPVRQHAPSDAEVAWHRYLVWLGNLVSNFVC